MFSRFIHIVVCIRITFLRLNNIPLIPPFVYPFICQWILGCCHLLATVNNPAMNSGVHLFKTLLLILWGIYPEVELLNHMVILGLFFLRNRSSNFSTSFSMFVMFWDFCCCLKECETRKHCFIKSGEKT